MCIFCFNLKCGCHSAYNTNYFEILYLDQKSHTADQQFTQRPVRSTNTPTSNSKWKTIAYQILVAIHYNKIYQFWSMSSMCTAVDCDFFLFYNSKSAKYSSNSCSRDFSSSFVDFFQKICSNCWCATSLTRGSGSRDDDASIGSLCDCIESLSRTSSGTLDGDGKEAGDSAGSSCSSRDFFRRIALCCFFIRLISRFFEWWFSLSEHSGHNPVKLIKWFLIQSKWPPDVQ